MADCVGIVAQMRLHHSVSLSWPDNAYADASAIEVSSRTTAASPRPPRTYADAVVNPAVTGAGVVPAPAAPPIAPAPQRLAQAAVAIPAFKSRNDASLSLCKLAEVAPGERVELAIEVHAAQHRVAIHRAAARLGQRDPVQPTRQSLAAAFGGGGADSLALP